MLVYFLEFQINIDATLKKVVEMMIGMDQKITTLQQDVQHCHFMLGKVARNEVISQEELEMERITQYIPCKTYRDLQLLDHKLEQNEAFCNHAVKYCFYFYFLAQLSLILRICTLKIFLWFGFFFRLNLHRKLRNRLELLNRSSGLL